MTDIQRNRALRKLNEIRDLEADNKKLGDRARAAQQKFRAHSQMLDPKRQELYCDMERMLG